MDGGHIARPHVFAALEGAREGPLTEGNVDGGAGMITYEFKGGTGTASRVLKPDDGEYRVGVIVQSNYGLRRQLRIAGIPVGERLNCEMPRRMDGDANHDDRPVDGSIIVVIATDAPLLPHQLRRLAKRPALAIGRLGGVGATTSGHIFLALSTANGSANENAEVGAPPMILNAHPNLGLTPLFEATIDATEEAILNALVAAESAEGANRFYVPRLPHDQIRDILRAHNLLKPQSSIAPH